MVYVSLQVTLPYPPTASADAWLPVIAVLNSALPVRFKSTVVVQAVPLYSKVLGVFDDARPPAPMAAFDVPVPVPLFSATGILTSVDQLVPLYLSEVDSRPGFAPPNTYAVF